ncbi:MAG TPA: hypothetical protein VJV78_13580 [Polyangiales bacterium]|nr:hypothetical protein [Polyangiales bacterium]
MEHTTSTACDISWGRPARLCLLLLTLSGCQTSNAVITGTPVAGQSASATGISSGAGTGNSEVVAPVASAGSAGVGGSNITPRAGTAAAGTSSEGRAIAGSSSGSPATAGTSSAMPTAMAGTSSTAGGGGGSQAGESGAAAGSAGSPPGSNDCRASKYSLAVRVTIDVKWEESIALMAGNEKGYLWSKQTIDPSSNTVSEFRSCGNLMPVVHTTALAGSSMSFQRVPQASYDQPSMPKQSGGSATRVDSVLTLDPGSLLVGVSLTDPAGSWPASAAAANVMPVDVDGDGKPGLTSAVRNDGGFVGAPTSVLANNRVDAMYNASRVRYRVMLKDTACADMLEGPAELVKLDTLVVGCHVKGGNDCSADESQFVEENRPKFVYAADAVAHAVVIPNDATCSQVVQLLNVPGP